MKTFSSLRTLLSAFFQRSQMDREMEAELRGHIQLRADDLERSGLPRAEAERLARIEFGGMERYKEECKEAARSQFGERLVQDVRYGLRVLRRSPGFTIAAVLTLALAICANAVVFGVLNALVLRPLNVPHEQSLYAIDRDGIGFESYPNYLDIRDRNRSFDQLIIFNFSQAGLDTGKDPSRIWGVDTSGNYFDALSIQPYLGRFFHASDEHGPNSAPYIVLSYAFWHNHFQDDRGVVGRTVRLNKHPFTILGVTPPDFHGTILFFVPDFFAPIVNQEQLDGENLLNVRDKRRFFEMMGHLKPGVTPAQATADLNSLGAYLQNAYPKENGKMNFALVRPGLGGDFLGGPIREFVAGLMLLAILILLAACANLGSLFGARAADRARELALRLALGSSRSRIIRTLLTEAMLISLAGGAVGLWASVMLLRRLSVWQPFPRFPMNVPVSPDANVYGVALVLAVVSGFLFGVVPIRQILRTDPYEIVKAGSAGRPGRRVTMRDLLLGAQIAICAVLVTSSMVALRGLVRSMHSNIGIEPENAMLVNIDLSAAGYKGDDAVLTMRKQMISALETIPGVQSVGLTDLPTLSFDGHRLPVFTDETTDIRPPNAVARPFTFNIGAQYFDAAGTSLLAGRTFTWHDDKNVPPVAVINQEFARKVLGADPRPLGRYFKLSDGRRAQVVGMVEDGKYFSLAEAQSPAVFLPIQQSSTSQTWLVVRSKDGVQKLAPAIRSKLLDLDEGLPAYIQPWKTEMGGVLFAPRVATVALGILGVMGAMLSITGIFGMAAYSVSKRLRELGIRMALGAQHREVLQAALARPFKLLAIGSLIGLILGILATRVLASIVYQATSRDPIVLAGAVLAMAFLGLLATWIPARRALSVNPLMLLREE
jgi:predicted permease